MDEDALGGADMLVLSPGLSAQEPIVFAARERGVPVVGDVELFARVATAAVIAASAPESRRLARNGSTKGAPAKIQSIDGTKVTHVVIAAPRTPAVTGEKGAASRKAARKPTNCVTRMRGPGVVSARPRPSTISGALIQP